MTMDAAEDAAPSPDAILQLGLGFWGAKALLSAVELGLHTHLAETGPLPAAVLGTQLGLHPRGLHDFLDALVALGMLRRDAAGRYGNTPATDAFLVRGRPGYVGGLLEMANLRLYPFWDRLTTALRTGRPQNEAADGRPDPFAAIYANPAALQAFLAGMAGLRRPVARAIAGAVPFADRRCVADIGCAQGGCLAELLRAHPHLTGIGFDLPPVQPVFEAFAAGQGLDGRARFVAGDLAADPWPAADVLVMGHVLHDRDLDQKLALLRKAHAALPPGGALLVYDAMIDDARRERAFGLLTSLNMLIETPGGFGYSGADCRRWMAEAGFAETRLLPLQGLHSLAIGIR